MICAAAAAGCGVVLKFKPYIANRFAAWQHVWEFADTTGYQQTRTMSAAASRGLLGMGPATAGSITWRRRTQIWCSVCCARSGGC